MARAWRCSLWSLGILLGLPVLILVALLLAANTAPGRAWIEANAGRLSGGLVSVEGLAGRFPDDFRLARLTLTDKDGIWLTLDNPALDWSPLALFRGTVKIDRLAASRVAMPRLPAGDAESEGSEASLPVQIDLRSLQVDSLELGPGVAGPFVRKMSAQGSLRLPSLEEGAIDLELRELEGEGTYRLHGTLDEASVSATLAVQEPPQGVIASLAGLTDLGPLTLDTSLQGPREAVRTAVNLRAGALQAQLAGTLDLRQMAVDLTLEAAAPAMQPRADLGWQDLALTARLQGPFARIDGKGNVAISGLQSAETGARRVAVDWQGHAGKLHAEGRLEGLRVPGAQPGLFEQSPIVVNADVGLDTAERPVKFVVQHALLTAEGTLTTAPDLQGGMRVRLPELAPWAAVGGLTLRGRADLQLDVQTKADAIHVNGAAKLSVSGGEGPLPALIGEAATLETAVVLQGSDVSLSRLVFRGKALEMNAEGGLRGNALDVDWKLALADLRALTPDIGGRLSAAGEVKGPLDDFAVSLKANSTLKVRDLPRGPLSLTLDGKGFPAAPRGLLKVEGTLAGARVRVAARLQRERDGPLRLNLEQAQWKSATAKAGLILPPGAAVPLGSLDLKVGTLADFGALLGFPLQGSLTASLASSERRGRPHARLQVLGRDLAVDDGVESEALSVDLSVADVLQRAVVDGSVSLTGLAAGGSTGTVRMELSGPKNALTLGLNGDLKDPAGAGLQLQAGGRFDADRATLTLAELQAGWKGETLHLLAPARFALAGGVTVDRLALGLRGAQLEARGQLSPQLKLSLSVRDLPASLVDVFQPGLGLDGRLQADARLSGPYDRPEGSMALTVEGLRQKSGPAQGLPSARVQLRAELKGEAARIEGSAKAGSYLSLSISGDGPLNAEGPLAVLGKGFLDLKVMDPLLSIHGRRARGRLLLDGGVAGTYAAPRLTGVIQLERGEWQDYGLGVHLSNLTALLQAEGDDLRLVRLQGRAGKGTLEAHGTLGVLRPGLPVDLTLAARKANALSSQRLAVNINADVGLKGRLRDDLAASGKIFINRADIRIPENLPATIAVLKVREAGEPPPPPPAPGPDLALDLTLDAPGEIFVRGQGLDAELAGTVQLKGSVQALQANGSFTMRRGQLSLAGQTLTFSKGEVGFDGGRLTDPSLNFVAQTSSNNVTASLAVTGSAQKPKISLSSVPELPQDEVLSQLLFKRSASSLGPFELVQIAAALASLAGITPRGSDPLERIRSGLGLDRLAIGGDKGPTLEGGRYVAPGVYVGAKQGASANATQGTVQIDITRGLKLEATVGSGSSTGSTSGTNSVGVIYQFEY